LLFCIYNFINLIEFQIVENALNSLLATLISGFSVVNLDLDTTIIHLLTTTTTTTTTTTFLL